MRIPADDDAGRCRHLYCRALRRARHIDPGCASNFTSFALGPLAIRLQRWGLGRVTSVVIVVLLAFVALGGFGVLIGSQLVQLAKNLPTYQSNIHTKRFAPCNRQPATMA